MNVTAVVATTLAAIGYDDARRLLQLEFCSRAVYEYFGVPPAMYDGLLRAASKGSYFNRMIRGRYPYARAEWRGTHGSRYALAGGYPWHAQ